MGGPTAGPARETAACCGCHGRTANPVSETARDSNLWPTGFGSFSGRASTACSSSHVLEVVGAMRAGHETTRTRLPAAEHIAGYALRDLASLDSVVAPWDAIAMASSVPGAYVWRAKPHHG